MMAQPSPLLFPCRDITYRCGKGHGRFSPFSSFMIEKGFVRMLTRPEVEDIAKPVDVMDCTGCGAPVDICKDAACPHCHNAFSLIDPVAVEQALQGYAKANKGTALQAGKASDIADALILIVRDRERTLREQRADRNRMVTATTSEGVDLLSLGIALVASTLD
jgi:hypothetical protein